MNKLTQNSGMIKTIKYQSNKKIKQGTHEFLRGKLHTNCGDKKTIGSKTSNL